MKDAVLLDEDAYVVGISFFPAAVSGKLTGKMVIAMADAAGIKLPKRQSLKSLLITFGKELYAAGKVDLSKTVGISRNDVTII